MDTTHVTALWLVGAPGSGKTTLVRELLGPSPRLQQKPKWSTSSSNPLVSAAGHYGGGTFDGADTIAYNGAADALAWWTRNLARPGSLTVFDGDRLSNATGLALVQGNVLAPLRCVCVLMQCPPAVLDARRRERGSDQNDAWMKGRQTKAERFHALPSWDARMTLDATAPVTALAAQLQAALRSL
jgi:hypothetical protein